MKNMSTDLETGLLAIVTGELTEMKARLRMMTILLVAILTKLGIDLSKLLGA